MWLLVAAFSSFRMFAGLSFFAELYRIATHNNSNIACMESMQRNRVVYIGS